MRSDDVFSTATAAAAPPEFSEFAEAPDDDPCLLGVVGDARPSENESWMVDSFNSNPRIIEYTYMTYKVI